MLLPFQYELLQAFREEWNQFPFYLNEIAFFVFTMSTRLYDIHKYKYGYQGVHLWAEGFLFLQAL